MVGSNTSSNGKLQLLGLAETFGGQVTGMEATAKVRRQSQAEAG